MANDSDVITERISDYELDINMWMFFFNVFFCIVYWVKYISVISFFIMIPFIIIYLYFVSGYESGVPLSCRLVSIFLIDFLYIICINYNNYIKAFKYFIKDFNYSIDTYFLIAIITTFILGFAISVYINSIFGFALCGVAISVLVYGDGESIEITRDAWKFLVIYIFLTLVYLLFEYLMRMKKLFVDITDRQIATSTGIANFIYLLLVCIYSVYLKYNFNTLSIDNMYKSADSIYTKMILIIAFILGLTIVGAGIKEDSIIRLSTFEEDNAFNVRIAIIESLFFLGVLLGYLLLYIGFKHYTSFNIFIITFFMLYFIRALSLKLKYYDTYSLIVNLVITFINCIGLILLIEKGLVICIVITFAWEYILYNDIKYYLKKKDYTLERIFKSDKTVGEINKDFSEAFNNPKMLTKIVIYIGLECIGWFCSRQCYDGMIIDLTGTFGFPRWDYVAILLIFIFFALITIYILFYKNPLGFKGSLTESGLVITFFLLGCICLIRRTDFKVNTSLDDYHINLEIASDTEKSSITEIKYYKSEMLSAIKDDYIYISGKDIDLEKNEDVWKIYDSTDIRSVNGKSKKEKITVIISDNDGNATIQTAWYPFRLAEFFGE